MVAFQAELLSTTTAALQPNPNLVFKKGVWEGAAVT
jgi:hypothetical protein